MDEADLRVFLALCETENTRDAAADLRVNQSNVSRALARIEAELGAELFSRHGRRLSLNRLGAAFRPDAARIVEQYELGRRHVRQLSGTGATIRLGFLQSAARRIVPQLIGGFRQGSEQVRFELRQGFARELFSWVKQDALDVAFVTPPRASDQGLAWRQLLEQRLCVAVPAGHRLAGRSAVTAKDLDGEDFIAFARSTELRSMIDPILAEARVEVRIAFESSEIDTIRGLVSAGLGIAILPFPSVRDLPDPLYLDLEPARFRSLGLVWSTERANPASVQRFGELCAGLDLTT